MPTQLETSAAGIRFRRALSLLVMTLVLPGSAQLVAGNARMGRVALRTCAAIGVLLVLVIAAGLVRPALVTAVLFSPVALGLLRAVLVLLALGWAVLFVDAWRLGDPLGLQQRQRLAVFSLNGALCFVVSGALLFGSHLVEVHRSLIVEMFGSGVESSADNGRYNVLLLGGDAGETRSGMRPDSLTVASIDEETGRTVLVGLPRNLENVPFPAGTPMAEAFPDGFDCGSECLLNAIYTWAADNRGRFDPDIEDVGAYATKLAVQEITGLKINYYVMVDLRGFQDLVDAVGGVTVNVAQRVPIGGGSSDITGWIEPGRRHLDGFHTLWFARSRETSDDYSRMARQKCVMSAMLNQLRPATVLVHFQDIAEASQRTVTTDIPASQLSSFVDLAAKAKELPVSTVSIVPPKIQTYDPDYDTIAAMVDEAVAKAEAADQGVQADPAAGSEELTAAERKERRERRALNEQANDTGDLSRACG
ncbi:MAG TPA: LCP family protein [Nocardioidaceae bacterium]|nr:LCP family protein [Actinomycetota bacterium]HEV8055295.1 LCP family protein [Nocardioidaceae bacterium]